MSTAGEPYKLAFAIIGTVLAVISFGAGIESRNFLAGAVQTKGTVIKLVGKVNDAGESPIVRYQVDGVSYEVEEDGASSPPAHSIGDVVTVVYQPGRPERGRVASDAAQPWFIFATVSAAVGVWGPFGVIRKQRERHKSVDK